MTNFCWLASCNHKIVNNLFHMSQCKAFTYFTVSKTANQSWSYYSDMSLTMGSQFCSQRGTNPQCGSNLSNHTKKSYSKVVSLTNWWKFDGQKYKNNFSTSFDKLILINFTDFKDQFWWETCIISWMKVLSFVLKAEHFTNAPPPFFYLYNFQNDAAFNQV